MAELVAARAMRESYGKYLDRAYHGRERFILHRRGERMAALIGIREYELLLPYLEDLEDYLDVMDTLEGYTPGEGLSVLELHDRMRARGDL
jgi:hypothetical protein